MRLAYILIGFLCLGLGSLGAALPVLPTVPFLLVSAFCFSRSSRRLDRWFRSTWLYKRHLEAFMRDRSMLLGTKIAILSFATLMLTAVFLLADSPIVRGIILLLAAGQYACFIFWVKTRRPGDPD